MENPNPLKPDSFLISSNASSPILLSIIILNYKTPDLVLTCIQSIYIHRPTVPFEIIVVDNGSADESEYRITSKYPEVRFIQMGHNLGFTRGNNLGIYNSHGEFIVLLNSDTFMIEPTFDQMVQYLKAHPEVGIVGPRQIDGEERFQLSFGHFPTFFSEIIRKILHYRLSINDTRVREYLDEKYSVSSVVDWVSGSCLMVRRETLHQTGLLDEQFFMYFEDIDICTRVRKKGWYTHYLPLTTIVHYGGQSARHNLLKALVEYRKSQIYFANKYYGFFGEFAVRILLVFKFGIHLFRWGTAYILDLIFKRDPRNSYTRALLSKKVIFQCFERLPVRPQEPVLGALSQTAK